MQHHIRRARTRQVTIGLLNWIAPCTLKSEDIELQANMAAAILANNHRNMIAMLNPQFTYRKGQLWVAEELVMKTMSSRAVNMDKTFAVSFEKRVDTRDARPLFYDGRLLTAAGVKEGEHFFKDVPIMQGVVQAAKMLKSSQMLTVEDCSDIALPGTTDVDGTIQGAAKFQQLGTDAWCNIMDACTDGMNFTDRGALLFFEINFGVGNGFDAFLEKKKGLRVPAF